MKLIHAFSLLVLSGTLTMANSKDDASVTRKDPEPPEIVGVWKSPRDQLTLYPDRRFEFNGGPKIEFGIWEESRDRGFYLRYRARNQGEAGLSRAGHFILEEGKLVFNHDDEVERFEKIGEVESLNEQAVETAEAQALQMGTIKVMDDFSKRVALLLKDFEKLKPGMSRQEIREMFPRDGGIHGVSQERFTHPECPYFKVDVEFEYQRDPDDQNRAISGNDDRATRISKPYLEGPILD